MGKELRLLLNLIENKKEEENNGYKIYSGKIGTHDIFAMQCGIGKVNAAIGTLTLINEYAPELVINTGVAGGADLSVGQMDIVVGKNIAHHDVWCGPGTEYGEASGFPLYFNSDEKITFDRRQRQIWSYLLRRQVYRDGRGSERNQVTFSGSSGRRHGIGIHCPSLPSEECTRIRHACHQRHSGSRKRQRKAI